MRYIVTALFLFVIAACTTTPSRRVVGASSQIVPVWIKETRKFDARDYYVAVFDRDALVRQDLGVRQAQVQARENGEKLSRDTAVSIVDALIRSKKVRGADLNVIKQIANGLPVDIRPAQVGVLDTYIEEIAATVNGEEIRTFHVFLLLKLPKKPVHDTLIGISNSLKNSRESWKLSLAGVISVYLKGEIPNYDIEVTHDFEPVPELTSEDLKFLEKNEDEEDKWNKRLESFEIGKDDDEKDNARLGGSSDFLSGSSNEDEVEESEGSEESEKIDED